MMMGFSKRLPVRLIFLMAMLSIIGCSKKTAQDVGESAMIVVASAPVVPLAIVTFPFWKAASYDPDETKRVKDIAVSDEPPYKPGPIDSSFSQESSLGVIHVKYDNLYIYSEPGFNGSKILQISKNDPLTAMTEKDKWVEVQCPTGEKGWIAKSWIDTK